MSTPSSPVRTSLALISGVAAVLGTGRARAEEPAPPDTSKWKCETCPFVKGHDAEYEAGGGYVSDDAARFGNATGYDESGGYVVADGAGQFVSENQRVEWEFEDLGLDSRALQVEGGRPGVYRYQLDYGALPYRRYDTTETPFQRSSDELLVLPGSWVPAGTTGGFTALDASLAPRDIESDREHLGVGGEFVALGHLRLRAAFRRDDREGWGIAGAPFFTSTSLLAVPFEDHTDTADFAASYDRERWSTSLSWSGSFYENPNDELRWDNPYSGGGQGSRAQSPDNKAQTLSLTGAYRFTPETVLSFNASMGDMRQDELLLPYTINPAVPPKALPRESLDGKIDTTHVDVGFTSRPWSFLRLKGVYRYDDRDNRTPVEQWTRTITDLFDSGEPESNRPYSFTRSKLELSAAARLDFWDWLKAFEFEAGYDLVELDRTLQEVTGSTEETGWGRVRWRPSPATELTLRGGVARRDPDDYDLDVAQAEGQNPLMRQYHQAYRYREFAQLNARTGIGDSPFTIGAEFAYASDDYTESPLGLREHDDLRLAVDLSWAINEKASVYLQAGYETQELANYNSETFAAADWNSRHEDRFTSLDAGFRFGKPDGKFDGSLNLRYAKGIGEIDMDSTFSGSGAYPDLETDLKGADLELGYHVNSRLELRFNLRWEDFASSDWALAGVEPATIPTVLTLGADPYDYDVFVTSLSFRYSFGAAPPKAEEESEASQ